MPVTADFDNERGNAIHLEVGRLPLPEDPSVKAVRYLLQGPTSLTEQIMTRKEAAILGRLLLAAAGEGAVRKSRRLGRRVMRRMVPA
jgi:hypothetical protein